MTDWTPEPYLDWDGITEEMAKDLHANFALFRQAQVDFANMNPLETEALKAAAAKLLRSQHELQTVGGAIMATLYTVPVVVHVAGGRTEAADSEGNELVVQRCMRCGSVLRAWTEGLRSIGPEGSCEVTPDDMVWWDEGEIVAKSASDDDRQIYRVGDRELEGHERTCPDLTALGT